MVTRQDRRRFLEGACGVLALLTSPVMLSRADHGDVSWLGDVQRPPQSVNSNGPAPLNPLLVAEDGMSITTVPQWETHRAALCRQWMDFLGPMPDRPPVKLETVSEDKSEGCRRLLVRYEAEAGQAVEGYLLYPQPLADGPQPALVVFHSTTPDTIEEVAGLKGRNAQALGLQFARQGFVVFCPKCFLWQDPSLDYDEAAASFRKSHPGTLGMRKMLHDAQCAVDVLASLPEVDSDRIGAIGHSLGAKETLYLMAFDERVRAGVFSEGGIGLSFTNWHAPWYLGAGIREPGFALNHHQLLGLIAPRPFLILAGESGPPDTSVADGDRTWPYVEAALPVYRLYGEPARIGLYNHHQGHTIPAEAFNRMSEWLRTYLTSGA